MKSTTNKAEKSAGGNARTSRSKKNAPTSNGSSGAGTAKDAIALFSEQHKAINGLFAQYRKLTDERQRADAIDEIARQLTVHAQLEEEFLDPEYRNSGADAGPADVAQVQRDIARLLVAELATAPRDAEYADAIVTVLGAHVKIYAKAEEAKQKGLFAQARAAGIALDEMGAKAMERQTELLSDENAIDPTAPSIRSLQLGFVGQVSPQEYATMENRGNNRERDDQGRFMSDDDDEYRGGSSRGSSSRSSRGGNDDDYRGSSSRGSSSRSSRDEDDDRRGGGRGQGGWFGDSEGHSEASRRGWEERGSSRGSSRSSQYDDDRNGGRGGRSGEGGGGGSRGGNRGEGGWFGDSEGHSEASRRGWESRGSRGSSRSSSDGDDDYQRGSSRSRSSNEYDDDRRSGGGRSGGGGGGGRGGWFGDSEGHSQASREGWRNSDHEGSGWYGDSEGHSDASRRGWRNSDHEGSGWYGDSEGHSEASRRGWEERGSRGSSRSSRSDDDDRRGSRSSSRR